MRAAWTYALERRSDNGAVEHMLALEQAGKNRPTLVGSLEALLRAAPGADVSLRSPAQRAQDEMVAALADLAFGADTPEKFMALSGDAQANLRRIAREFRELERTPEQVQIFGRWWYEAKWKSKPPAEITAPALKQIKNQWFGAMHWREKGGSQSAQARQVSDMRRALDQVRSEMDLAPQAHGGDNVIDGEFEYGAA